MTIKEEIAKIEGLAEALKNEIEVWFEKHFDEENHAPAKGELHEVLGTTTTTAGPATPAVPSVQL